jgi:hypothetical protein
LKGKLNHSGWLGAWDWGVGWGFYGGHFHRCWGNHDLGLGFVQSEGLDGRMLLGYDTAFVAKILWMRCSIMSILCSGAGGIETDYY